MFVRITWGKLKPGSWNHHEAAYRKVMPKTLDVPGISTVFSAEMCTLKTKRMHQLWESLLADSHCKAEQQLPCHGALQWQLR